MTQIQITKDPTGTMLAVGLRQAMILVGGWAAARGYVASDTVDMSLGVAAALAPIVYGLMKTLWTHRKLVRLGNSVSDAVAVVK
jgi:hypothetical protein